MNHKLCNKVNTIGRNIRLTTFGESHGPAMGGVLDGLPAGVSIVMERVQRMLERRRTGLTALTSQRREEDRPEVLSGISADGRTLGSPIGFIFRNSDARSGDYKEIEDLYRPSHADYTYDLRYGLRDPRGGGRASARDTVNWVMGGALAMEWLSALGISIEAKVVAVGTAGYRDLLWQLGEAGADAELPDDPLVEGDMLEEVAEAKREGDSVGGMVCCLVKGMTAGCGAPQFGKMQSRLAAAMLSINAARSFEYGLGAGSAEVRGSDYMDNFYEGFEPAPFESNRSGGALGGITTGMPIFFQVAFKPTPTIGRPVGLADKEGHIREAVVKGRHDPCVALRAPVIVEAMTALTLADMLMEKSEVRSQRSEVEF